MNKKVTIQSTKKYSIKKPVTKKCSNSCKKHIYACPLCHKVGMSVPLETVQTLTQMSNIGENFYLCTSPNCQVIYYNNEYIFNKCDITTKVWYKGSIEEFIVCYCQNIKLIDIINAVTYLRGNNNKEDVLKYLNKNQNERNCLHKNPTGISCDKLFENALEFAKERYNKLKGE